MTIKFTSVEKRDELVQRLAELAFHMQRSFDQGHDGRIAVNDEMIDDIRLAAAIVALAEVTSEAA